MSRLLADKSLLVIALTAIVLVSWFCFVLLPLQARQSSVASDMRNLKEESRSAELILHSSGEVKARASRTSERMQHFLSSIYDSNSLSQFLASLELTANNHGLHDVVIIPEMNDLLKPTTTPFGEAHLRQVALQVSCRGRFLSVGRFIERLQSQSFFAGLISLSISQNQDAAAELLCSFKFAAYMKGAGRNNG